MSQRAPSWPCKIITIMNSLDMMLLSHEIIVESPAVGNKRRWTGDMYSNNTLIGLLGPLVTKAFVVLLDDASLWKILNGIFL